MRRLFIVLLITFPGLTSAQDLHTFSNGEVADAEKINENFQYVLQNATGSGGCSAEQDGSSVVITCADGTSGVLASEGTVVVYVPGEGLPVDLSQLRLGALVVKDATGVILGEVDDWSNNAFDVHVELADRPNVIIRIVSHRGFHCDDSGDVKECILVGGTSNYLGRVYFQDENCVGIPFGISDPGTVSVNETLYGWGDVGGGNVLYKSSRNVGFRNRDGRDEPQGECHNGEGARYLRPYLPLTPPSTFTSAAYPLSIEQLP